jgi:hypothetical protein
MYGYYSSNTHLFDSCLIHITQACIPAILSSTWYSHICFLAVVKYTLHMQVPFLILWFIWSHTHVHARSPYHAITRLGRNNTTHTSQVLLFFKIWFTNRWVLDLTKTPWITLVSRHTQTANTHMLNIFYGFTFHIYS